ncbi:hypothetical protein QBC38DRAFT_268495 [Podospora fimiseda]|uniref:Uncharacterized protein n=1 Tax=Podospora fimiseda TaxID=252190 RepID=A0AAN7BKY2_9PEZI|nr:hypothetical protein QBC38DRAFT_268495 [Podospora fimiseda]
MAILTSDHHPPRGRRNSFWHILHQALPRPNAAYQPSTTRSSRRPNHSFLFGHLFYFKSFLDRLPKGAHYQFGFATIAREVFSDTGAFYMDLWPMSGLIFTVVSPPIGVQITQENPALTSERPELLKRFMKTNHRRSKSF